MTYPGLQSNQMLEQKKKSGILTPYLSLLSILSFTDAFKSVVNVVIMHLEINTNKYFFL